MGSILGDKSPALPSAARPWSLHTATAHIHTHRERVRHPLSLRQAHTLVCRNIPLRMLFKHARLLWGQNCLVERNAKTEWGTATSHGCHSVYCYLCFPQWHRWGETNSIYVQQSIIRACTARSLQLFLAIILITAYPMLRCHGQAGAYPSFHRETMGYTLKKSPIQKNKQVFTFAPTDILELEFPIHLMCMFLDCGWSTQRKPTQAQGECANSTQKGLGRKWTGIAHSASHCITIPPFCSYLLLQNFICRSWFWV